MSYQEFIADSFILIVTLKCHWLLVELHKRFNWCHTSNSIYLANIGADSRLNVWVHHAWMLVKSGGMVPHLNVPATTVSQHWDGVTFLHVSIEVWYWGTHWGVHWRVATTRPSVGLHFLAFFFSDLLPGDDQPVGNWRIFVHIRTRGHPHRETTEERGQHWSHTWVITDVAHARHYTHRHLLAVTNSTHVASNAHQLLRRSCMYLLLRVF